MQGIAYSLNIFEGLKTITLRNSVGFYGVTSLTYLALEKCTQTRRGEKILQKFPRVRQVTMGVIAAGVGILTNGFAADALSKLGKATGVQGGIAMSAITASAIIATYIFFRIYRSAKNMIATLTVERDQLRTNLQTAKADGKLEGAAEVKEQYRKEKADDEGTLRVKLEELLQREKDIKAKEEGLDPAKKEQAAKELADVTSQVVAAQAVLASTQAELEGLKGQIVSKGVELDAKNKEVINVASQHVVGNEHVERVKNELNELVVQEKELLTRQVSLNKDIEDKERSLQNLHREYLNFSRQAADEKGSSESELLQIRRDIEKFKLEAQRLEETLQQKTQAIQAQDRLLKGAEDSFNRRHLSRETIINAREEASLKLHAEAEQIEDKARELHATTTQNLQAREEALKKETEGFDELQRTFRQDKRAFEDSKEAREKELSELHTALKKDQETIAQINAVVGELEAKLTQRDEKFAKEKEDFAAEQRDHSDRLGKRTEELDKGLRAITEREFVVADKEKALSDRERAIANKEAEHSVESLRKREEAILKKERELRLKEEDQIETKLAEAAKEEELRSYQQQLEQLRQESEGKAKVREEQLQALLASKNEEIRILKAELQGHMVRNDTI